MIHGRVLVFLVFAVLFAATHQLALVAALYWYHEWFDVFMHLWGGALIALGLHALATFRSLKVRPTWTLLILILVLVTGSWELFERWAGIYNPETYIFDTTKDIVAGFIGGLLAHQLLRAYTMG